MNSFIDARRSGGRGLHGLDGDLVAESFELGDESADVGLLGESVGEVVPAEVEVRDVPVKQAVGDDQD